MYIANFKGSDSKIKPTRLMWDWLLKRRVYTGDIHEQPKKSAEKDEDVVCISDKAKRMLRNAEIEKTLNSGEPLKGVTYEEYCGYYYDKHGYRDTDSMQREYKQALKGDNAFLRENYRG